MTQLIGLPYRVQEASKSTFGGTGDVQLDGVPTTPLGRVTFSSGVGNGKLVRFLIDDGAGNWEISEGTVDDTGSPHTLSRDTVLKSSAVADAKVDFSTGVKDIVAIWIPTGWELVERLTASASSSLDFENGFDGEFDALKFVVTNLVPATDNVNPYVRVSVASTYLATSYKAVYTGYTSAPGANDSGVSGAAQISLNSPMGSDTGEGWSGVVELDGPNNTALYKHVRFNMIGYSSAAALLSSVGGGSYDGGTGAVDGLRFLFGSGNIESGTIAQYGMRK